MEITEDLIHGKAMTSEFAKIESLSLNALRITSVTYGAGIMRKMSKLQDLNLSNNRICKVSALSELKNLQSLVLMGNRIEEIGQLNLPVLTVLNLNYNQITAISGLRGLKKLEDLSLEKNQIVEASMQEIGFQLICLKELNLRNNKITRVTKLTGYPNIEKVILEKNPIFEIEPTAFKECTSLQSLDLAKI